MKPAILITRPRDEADSFARDAAELGYETVIAPVLTVEVVPYDRALMPGALVATSPQVFKQTLPDAWKDLPVFVMGAASAAKAKAQGFHQVMTAPGDFAELCDMLNTLPRNQKILYLRGETIRHDLKAHLTEYQIEERIVYKTNPLTVDLSCLEDGSIQIVTLFSARSALIFHGQIVGQGRSVKGIKLLCLSAAVLESVKSLPWLEIKVAQQPDQQAMLAALQGWK